MRVEGRVLKAARHLTGFTLTEVSSKSGVSLSYVKYLERQGAGIGCRARAKASQVYNVYGDEGVVFLCAKKLVIGVAMDTWSKEVLGACPCGQVRYTRLEVS